MKKHLSEGEVAVTYSPKFREYGIRILDGGSAIQVLRYCPWCGTELPRDLRDAWFESVEKLGLEPDEPSLPDEFHSDDWWRKRNL
jgi:hypothetical protein